MTEVFVDDSSETNSSTTTSNNPYSDIDTQNITKDELFEIIGQNVLTNWDSDSEFSLSKSYVESHPLEQLNHILSLPPDKLPRDWDDQVRKLLKKLSPTDFAIYGQQICLHLLDLKTEKKSKKSEMPKHNASKSSPTIKMRPKRITSQYQLSSRTQKYPKVSPSSSRSSIILSASKAKEYTEDKPFNTQIYAEFPPWLPTLND